MHVRRGPGHHQAGGVRQDGLMPSPMLLHVAAGLKEPMKWPLSALFSGVVKDLNDAE